MVGKLKHYLPQFWFIQLIGWGFYGIVKFALNFFFTGSAFDLSKAAFIAGGCGLSAGLYHYYGKIRSRGYGLVALVGHAFAGSLLAGGVWFLCCEALIVKSSAGELLNNLRSDPAPYLHLYLNLTSVFLGWSALYFGISFWHELQKQRELTANANAAIQQAKLQLLRYQLNPHFLFNAMNSLRALIDHQPKQARQMLTALSGFLRHALLDGEKEQVSLADEFTQLQHYFDIEKVRYEERLQVQTDMAPAVSGCRVPSLVLQPLVENAIKHGMRTSPDVLPIQVSAFRRNGTVCIEVANKGTLAQESPGFRGTGTGLRNVKRRLEQVYPGQHAFQLFEKDGWVRARMNIQRAAMRSHEEQNTDR